MFSPVQTQPSACPPVDTRTLGVRFAVVNESLNCCHLCGTHRIIQPGPSASQRELSLTVPLGGAWADLARLSAPTVRHMTGVLWSPRTSRMARSHIFFWQGRRSMETQSRHQKSQNTLPANARPLMQHRRRSAHSTTSTVKWGHRTSRFPSLPTETARRPSHSGAMLPLRELDEGQLQCGLLPWRAAARTPASLRTTSRPLRMRRPRASHDGIAQ